MCLLGQDSSVWRLKMPRAHSYPVAAAWVLNEKCLGNFFFILHSTFLATLLLMKYAWPVAAVQVLDEECLGNSHFHLTSDVPGHLHILNMSGLLLPFRYWMRGVWEIPFSSYI